MNTTLYQKDTKSKIKVWSIAVLNKGTYSEIITTAGKYGGKMVDTITKITEGKNSNKTNATTHYTQALAEAKSKADEKIRAGYVDDINKVQSQRVLGSGIPQPMLAHKYDPEKKQSKSKNLQDIGIENKTVFVQRKKDGNRCLIHVSATFSSGILGIASKTDWVFTAKMYTRKGDSFPDIVHITDSIRDSFAKIFAYVNGKYGVTEYWLDGELFTKAFSFNKLNGLVKKEKKTAADAKDCYKIKYHIYDVILDAGYETRRKIINYFKSPAVHVEESYEVVATEKNLQTYLEQFLNEGEEGAIVRVPGIAYENKRSWSLLKYKVFEDKEFKVLSFEESVKGGMAGAVWVEHDVPGAVDRDGNPITKFKAGLAMDHETCTEIWNNQQQYIGQQVTVEFFGRSEYTVPRFTKAKAFRNDI